MIYTTVQAVRDRDPPVSIRVTQRGTFFGTLYAHRNPRRTKDTHHTHDQTVVARTNLGAAAMSTHTHPHVYVRSSFALSPRSGRTRHLIRVRATLDSR